jgi:hypothetical protein
VAVAGHVFHFYERCGEDAMPTCGSAGAGDGCKQACLGERLHGRLGAQVS